MSCPSSPAYDHVDDTPYHLEGPSVSVPASTSSHAVEPPLELPTLPLSDKSLLEEVKQVEIPDINDISEQSNPVIALSPLPEALDNPEPTTDLTYSEPPSPEPASKSDPEDIASDVIKQSKPIINLKPYIEIKPLEELNLLETSKPNKDTEVIPLLLKTPTVPLSPLVFEPKSIENDSFQGSDNTCHMKKECLQKQAKIKLKQLDLEEWMCPVDLASVQIDTFFRLATSALVLLNKTPWPRSCKPRGGVVGARKGRKGGRRKRKKFTITRQKSKPRPVVIVEPVVVEESTEDSYSSPASNRASPSTCAAPEPKKFPCLECDKSFARKVSLNHHVYTKHGTSNMVQCHLCQKWLLDQCSLASHIKFVHPSMTNAKSSRGQDHDKAGSTPRSLFDDEFRSDPEGCLPFSPSSSDPPLCSKCGRPSLIESDGFDIHKECICANQLFPKEFSAELKSIEPDGPVPLSSPGHDTDLNLSISSGELAKKTHAKVYRKSSLDADNEKDEFIELTNLKNCAIPNVIEDNEMQDFTSAYMGSVIQHRGFNNAKNDFWNTCLPESKGIEKAGYSPPSFTSLQPVSVLTESASKNLVNDGDHDHSNALDSKKTCDKDSTVNDVSINLDSESHNQKTTLPRNHIPSQNNVNHKTSSRLTPSPPPSAAEVMDAVMRGFQRSSKDHSKSPAQKTLKSNDERSQSPSQDHSSDDSDATIINQGADTTEFSFPTNKLADAFKETVKEVEGPIISIKEGHPLEPVFCLDEGFKKNNILESSSDSNTEQTQEMSSPFRNEDFSTALKETGPTTSTDESSLPDLNLSLDMKSSQAQPVSVITSVSQAESSEHSQSMSISTSSTSATTAEQPTVIIVTACGPDLLSSPSVESITPSSADTTTSSSVLTAVSSSSSPVTVMNTSSATELVPAVSTVYTSVITGPTSITTTALATQTSQIITASTQTSTASSMATMSTIASVSLPQVLTTTSSMPTIAIPSASVAVTATQPHLLSPMYSSPIFSPTQYIQPPLMMSPNGGTMVSPGVLSPGVISPGAATAMMPHGNPLMTATSLMHPHLHSPVNVHQAGPRIMAPQPVGMLSPGTPSPMLSQAGMLQTPSAPGQPQMLTPTSTPTMVIPQTLMQDGQMTRQNVLVIQPDMYQQAALGGINSDPYSEVLQEPTSGRSSPDNIGSDLDDLIIFHNDTLPKSKTKLAGSDDSGDGFDSKGKKNVSAASANKKFKAKKDGDDSSIPDTSEESVTMCQICDGVSKALHYNARICTSCKIFFSSTVKTNHDVSFVCTNKTNEPCKIRYKNRKNCMYCRFQRCLAIGLSRDAVHEETAQQEERAKKRNRSQSTSNSTVNAADIAETSSETKPAPPKKKPPPKKKKKESDETSSSSTPDTPQPASNPQQTVYTYPTPMMSTAGGMVAYPPGQYIQQYICVNPQGQMIQSGPAYFPGGMQFKPGMMPMYMANHKGPIPQMMAPMVPMANSVTVTSATETTGLVQAPPGMVATPQGVISAPGVVQMVQQTATMK